ncbi:MBL fold metallo-hydrolase [Tardisphaera miroshnichenkoae]
MKVAEGIDLIDGTSANVYVFTVGDAVVQVDAGIDKSAHEVLSYYESRGIKPTAVVLTHSHIDHIRGLKAIFDLYRPSVYAHRDEIPVITGQRPQYSKNRLMGLLYPLFKAPTVPLVDDVSALALPNVRIIETPGHTPGSVTIVLERADGRFAFAGDAAFEKNGTLYVNERYSLDVKKARDSLKIITSLSPVTVLPGHGKPVRA